MNTVEFEGKTLPRFYVEDSLAEINIVSVLDRQLNGQLAVGPVSKPQGMLACGFLNESPHVPTESQPYQQLAFKAKTFAGRIPSVARAFESGMKDGISPGEEVNPAARIFRTEAHNEAYKAGVLLGQRIVHREVRLI